MPWGVPVVGTNAGAGPAQWQGRDEVHRGRERRGIRQRRAAHASRGRRRWRSHRSPSILRAVGSNRARRNRRWWDSPHRARPEPPAV